ncbi:MAG TPA: sulfur carrier protein ThiS [Phycisphaerae bacterium]|nr:sulfur carrier protein ThiS [Phycisphaerales bacterium]HNO77145.1 sulfur carrier protein ThiS [Phycisphaerae bacterium]
MQVIVNGKERELTGGISVSDLLDLYELEPIRAAVEINEELVPRATFSNTTIQPGDRIEIVTFVGGG